MSQIHEKEPFMKRSTMAMLAALATTACEVSGEGLGTDPGVRDPMSTGAPGARGGGVPGTDSADGGLGAAPPGAGPSPTSPTPSPTPGGAKTPAPAYATSGAKLTDPCGQEVVLRGINKMAVFADRKGDSFPEIAKTGANAVRFMWLTSEPATEAVQTIQRAIDSELVPMWELHDATGDFSKMPQIEAFWTDASTVGVLKQFESRLLVNLANEAGQTVSDATFTATYTQLVQKLRTAGVRSPFVIDAAGYGRNVEQLLRVAPGLIAADPLHNLVFSWHVYDSGAGETARIDQALATAAAQKLPLIFGEFGNVSPGACGQAVPYQHLITRAAASGVGYFPWSWDNFNGDCSNGTSSAFDMVADGLHASTLKAGWATEVVTTHAASIQKTSKRTLWQTKAAVASGKCGP